MPSKSKKQHNLMAMVANDPKAAKRVGIPQSVGEEFTAADKGKKFGTGARPDLQGVNKPKTDHGKMALFNKGGTMKPVDMKKNPGMGKLPAMVRNKMGYMKEGGMTKSDMKEDMPMMKKVAKQEVKAHEKSMHKMAKGGVTRADGCVSKGHTKGKTITMKSGGMC
jgi:hypothetical protein